MLVPTRHSRLACADYRFAAEKEADYDLADGRSFPEAEVGDDPVTVPSEASAHSRGVRRATRPAIRMEAMTFTITAG